MENVFKITKHGIIVIIALCLLVSIVGTCANVTAMAAEENTEETVVVIEEIDTAVLEPPVLVTDKATEATDKSTQELMPMMARMCYDYNTVDDCMSAISVAYGFGYSLSGNSYICDGGYSVSINNSHNYLNVILSFNGSCIAMYTCSRRQDKVATMYHIVRFDKSCTEDYLRIFDRDNSGSVVCYCTQWNMTQEEIDTRIIEPVKNNIAQLSKISREVAVEMIHADRIRGYLAYEGKYPVGWCNCDDKRNYSFLARHVSKEPEKDNIKSIVCLKVVREKDFFEVGSTLLESVCKLSKAEGYSYIEVYPHKGAMICTDFDSAMKLYLANGFKLLSVKNGEAVLRKEL